MTQTIEKKLINIAPSSDNGHFINGAEKVIALDEINETFLVEGKCILDTKNHTSLPIGKRSLITCQNVYNPFSKMFEKSKD